LPYVDSQISSFFAPFHPCVPASLRETSTITVRPGEKQSSFPLRLSVCKLKAPALTILSGLKCQALEKNVIKEKTKTDLPMALLTKHIFRKNSECFYLVSMIQNLFKT